MTIRSSATAALASIALLILVGQPAGAALREVAVGNFYFDDSTPGDGVVEANQGDQLRFTVYDGGPGTPHTVDVDALGIHSGSLAAGETFTTPPLDKPGTYTLYCKPHQNRGHKASLVVRASSTGTTSAPSTTAAPQTSTTRATTTTAQGGGTTTTTRAGGGGATSTTATSGGGSVSPTTGAPGAPKSSVVGSSPVPGPSSPPGPAVGPAQTAETLVPVGRGAADGPALANRPVDPDSLEAALGRPAATRGSWTRSLRLGLAALAAMLGVVVLVAQRAQRRLDTDA